MRTSEHQESAVSWIALLVSMILSGACSPSTGFHTTSAPEGAIDVQITTRRGTWATEYSALSKECDGRLVVPAGVPMAISVTGTHGTQRMCVQRLGLDQEVSANKPMSFWIKMEEPGRHKMGEGCPQEADTLEGTIQVVESSDWEAWLRSGDCAPLDPEASDYGERLFSRLGCSSCHSVTGEKGVGPSLNGLLGREETLVDGSTIVVDEAYIRDSIRRPSAQVVRGYAPTMPELGEALSPGQLDALVSYLTGLSVREAAPDEP